MDFWNIKLSLAGEVSTKGYRYLQIKKGSQPLEVIADAAVKLYCQTKGIDSLGEDCKDKITIDLEFRDNVDDLIIVKTSDDFYNYCAMLPSSYIGKVHAIVTPPKVEAASGTTTSATTQTEPKAEDKNEDKKIIDAISDIFAIAALSMKAGITAATAEKRVDKAVNEVTKKESDNKVARKMSKDTLKLAKKSLKVMHHALKSSPIGCNINGTMNPHPIRTECDRKSVEAPTTENPKVHNDVEVKEGEDAFVTIRPFIHGRHTCDQCLTTPIIGKRFHALNLPDYDLCETCHSNYKGVDIVFEEAQLERDVPFQERWNRKRAMHEGHLKPRVIHQIRCRMPQSHRSCNRCSKVKPPVSPMDTPIVESNQDDLALAEAIRRSVDDVPLVNEDSSKDISIVAASVVEKPQIMNTSTSVTTECEIVMEKPAEIKAEPEIDLSTKSFPCEHVNVDNSTSFANEAIGAGEVAEFVGETLDRMSEAIDDLNRDMIDKGDVVFESHYVDGVLESESSSDDDSKILDGEDDVASNGSWSVVVEKEHVSCDDEGLGRAAEVIGSALFQSDAMRSMEEPSAAVSSVTSVPTLAPSITTNEHELPLTQSQRWALQLDQLHELGFYDDAVNIDILEALSAANIGVDSNDEVTVQQVVQKLMDD